MEIFSHSAPEQDQVIRSNQLNSIEKGESLHCRFSFLFPHSAEHLGDSVAAKFQKERK